MRVLKKVLALSLCAAIGLSATCRAGFFDMVGGTDALEFYKGAGLSDGSLVTCYDLHVVLEFVKHFNSHYTVDASVSKIGIPRSSGVTNYVNASVEDKQNGLIAIYNDSDESKRKKLSEYIRVNLVNIQSKIATLRNNVYCLPPVRREPRLYVLENAYVINMLQSRFGTLKLSELVSLATVISDHLGLKLPRDAKRKLKYLYRWFECYWVHISPLLPMISMINYVNQYQEWKTEFSILVPQPMTQPSEQRVQLPSISTLINYL